ncbi:helix-turn-helix domain-containing protein [Mucilaginibacter pedocola]|nr:AraC family transcriptional regulator [Mucilaginibacter pedocola]
MLAHKNEPEKAMTLLQEWFVGRLSTKVNSEKLQLVQQACERIDEGSGVKTIKEVYTGMGISKSTLERHFLEVVGITPKMYSRIVRFNKVYNILQHGQYNTWQEVIYNFNFYDQAHFIKDFKKFFNRTPSEVHKSRVNSNELLGSVGD